MKTTQSSIIGLAIMLGVLLASCKKEYAAASNNTTNNTKDSILLSKYIELDTSNISYDTIVKIDYKYDDLKRLSELDTYAYLNGTFSGITHSEILYNGNDVKPYSCTSTDTTYSNNQAYPQFSTTQNYLYNSNGDIVYEKDLEVGYDSIVTSFIYSNNIYSISNYYGAYGGEIDTAFYQQSMSNNSIAAGFLSYQNNKGCGNNNGFNFTVSYDTHKNPFANLKILYVGHDIIHTIIYGEAPTEEQDGYFGGWGFSTNNVTNYTTLNTVGIPFNTNYTLTYSAASFIYNSNDYPESCSYSASDYWGNESVGKKFYYYTN